MIKGVEFDSRAIPPTRRKTRNRERKRWWRERREDRGD